MHRYKAQFTVCFVYHVCPVFKISFVSFVQKVGTISANGEREIGELIAKAMEKVGKEGVITIAVSTGMLVYPIPLTV